MRIVLTDAGVDAASPDPTRAQLATMMTAPFPLTAEMSETVGAPGSELPVTLRVADVIDATHIRLARPLRKDCPLTLQPHIVRFRPVQEVGIESLRITTEWPGQYKHHHPYPPDATGDAIVRTKEEQDYLWTAIQIARASDCWVRDVVISDVNQGVMLYEADHVTLDGLAFEGTIGHVGVGLTRTYDSLVRGVRYDTRFVHSVLAAVFASGNVVTASEATVWGFDAYSTADSTVDHHGLFPYENLYDDLRRLYIVAGGPSERLPHAGVRTTFWNLEVPDRMAAYGEGDEIFRTYATDRTSAGTERTNHELWPESFVLGTTRIGGGPVLVGGSADDRSDVWLTVERTGTEVAPRSLLCPAGARAWAGHRELSLTRSRFAEQLAGPATVDDDYALTRCDAAVRAGPDSAELAGDAPLGESHPPRALLLAPPRARAAFPGLLRRAAGRGVAPRAHARVRCADAHSDCQHRHGSPRVPRRHAAAERSAPPRIPARGAARRRHRRARDAARLRGRLLVVRARGALRHAGRGRSRPLAHGDARRRGARELLHLPPRAG